MSLRRRTRASWLLVVLFSTVTLGLCTTALSASAGKPPCCADLGDKATFSSCCQTGQEPSSSDLPPAARIPVAPLPVPVIARTPPTPDDRSIRREASASLPYRSADRQALFSIFLI